MASEATIDSSIPLVLVVDVRLYREGLAAALPSDSLKVVGLASTRDEAIAAVKNSSPLVVIVDVSMPDALELIKQLKTDHSSIQLIGLAVDENIDAVVACAEAGAAAYVSANDGMTGLVKAIVGVVNGELHCSPQVAAALFKRVSDVAQTWTLDDSSPQSLSNRERQVLRLLRQHLTNKEIASQLNISEATVKNHVHHLLEKLNVRNRHAAAAFIARPSRAGARNRGLDESSTR